MSLELLQGAFTEEKIFAKEQEYTARFKSGTSDQFLYDSLMDLALKQHPLFDLIIEDGGKRDLVDGTTFYTVGTAIGYSIVPEILRREEIPKKIVDKIRQRLIKDVPHPNSNLLASVRRFNSVLYDVLPGYDDYSYFTVSERGIQQAGEFLLGFSIVVNAFFERET